MTAQTQEELLAAQLEIQKILEVTLSRYIFFLDVLYRNREI